MKRLDYNTRTDISEVVWGVIRWADNAWPQGRDFRREKCVRYLGPYAQELANARHPLIGQQLDDGGGWTAGVRLLSLEFLLDLYEDGAVTPNIEAHYSKQQAALEGIEARLRALLKGI